MCVLPHFHARPRAVDPPLSQGQNRRQFMVFAHPTLAPCENPQKPTRILTFSPQGRPRDVPEHPSWPHTASKNASRAPPAAPEHPRRLSECKFCAKNAKIVDSSLFSHIRALASCKNHQKPTRILTFSPHEPPRDTLSGHSPEPPLSRIRPKGLPGTHRSSLSGCTPPRKAPPEHPRGLSERIFCKEEPKSMTIRCFLHIGPSRLAKTLKNPP